MVERKGSLFASILLATAAPLGTTQTQLPMAGAAIPKWVDELPALDTIVAGSGQIELRMTEFRASPLPTGFVPPAGWASDGPGTWVWGYLQPDQTGRATHLGPVIVATRGVPTAVRFVNNLGTTASTRLLAYNNSVDQTLHWADPAGSERNQCAHMLEPGQRPVPPCDEHYQGPIPAVAHLHGGEVPPVLDGGPDSWFLSQRLSGYLMHGHGYYSGDGNRNSNWATYRYPNSQQAAPLWFHDHTLGATRLNVYAGLAGGYLVVDPGLDLPPDLPGPADIIPVVIQDRMFDTHGQLYFPAGVPYIGNPEHPYWVPEFVGDTILVNGKVWPKKSVEKKRYRFLFLNGSNARAYELFLTDPGTGAFGPPMWVIGTDGGYLDFPVKLDPARDQALLMLPGERYEVIIDFADTTNNPSPSGTLILRNTGHTPYPRGEAPHGSTLGQIVKFVVGARPPGGDQSFDPARGGALRVSAAQRLVRLVDPVSGTLAPGVTIDKARQMTLNEVIGEPEANEGSEYPGGPLEILVNNTRYDGESKRTYQDFTPITVNGNTTWYSELPAEGATELWEIVNLTEDAHPIHLHLVQFQILNRQSFDTRNYETFYDVSFPLGLYQPAFGPPLDYRAARNPLSGGKDGGNPDVMPFLRGPVLPPGGHESGWKDTAVMLPGQVTRIVVRWAPTDLPIHAANLSYPFDPDGGHGYVWHCHIIDHEDNEMMRPTSVTPRAGAMRTFVRGVDY